jgi:hypothetical protein
MLFESRRDALTALCRCYHVRRLALFGSALSDTFSESSDLDFAVEFEPLSPSDHKESYFGLLAALENLFDRSVDLVECGPIDNPYFLQELLATQVMVYEAA